jgi:HrpA-like RNA helicase
MNFSTPLPIDAVLDDLTSTLARSSTAVLVAPPGAGKTTRVPLALLDADWTAKKKIIVLEPRRIAARRCRADGSDAGREGRRDRRLSCALRLEGLARNAH